MLCVDLDLKKIDSLELDKKNLLVKLFDANEPLNNVKTENMLLLDKVKTLELFVAKEQTTRFACFKFDHIDRKSTRLNSSHLPTSRMPSSA